VKKLLPAIAQANAALPHLEIEAEDDGLERAIKAQWLGRYHVARFRAPATVVETVGRRSASAGLDKHLKLVWQLGGSMRYEDANRSFDIKPGDLILAPMNGDYRFEMKGDHDALQIAFDPADAPQWPGLVMDVLGTRIEGGDATMAAAGGVSALLARGGSDRTAELAARTMIDLALASTRMSEAREPPLLARAGLNIVRNIADPDYGPAKLARELGMSRRTLYTRLAALGTTPAALIRRIRLDRARQDVRRNDGRSLLDIALANGFPDGASLSHAFQRAFAQSPSAMRAEISRPALSRGDVLGR